MIEYLPGYYRASRIMGATLSAQGQEIDKLFDAMDQTLEQFFISTATWGLSLWEELLGLPINETFSIEERRQRLLTKRRGVSQPLLIILKAIAPALEARFGGDVIPFVLPVDHNADEYDFSSLVPPLEVYKPAHKAYSLTLLAPDLLSGYAVFGGHDAGRGKVALQLEAGSGRAGRWPRWNSPGYLRVAAATAQGAAATGTCLFPRIGVSVGSALSAIVTVIAAPRQGIYLFPEAGQHKAGEMPTVSTVGASMQSMAQMTAAAPAGTKTYNQCGQYYSGEVAA